MLLHYACNELYTVSHRRKNRLKNVNGIIGNNSTICNAINNYFTIGHKLQKYTNYVNTRVCRVPKMRPALSADVNRVVCISVLIRQNVIIQTVFVVVVVRNVSSGWSNWQYVLCSKPVHTECTLRLQRGCLAKSQHNKSYITLRHHLPTSHCYGAMHSESMQV
jgi:hypothetical protein